MPASPGYPFIRAGRRRCSETPYVHACALRESSAGAAQRERRRRRGICIYRCEMAALLAWRAACVQWRRLCACMLGRIRACLPGIASAIASSCGLRVACVQCCLCKECGCEQSWQHCASHGVRHACVLDDAQPVSIIPCVRARERGRHGLRRPGQRAGAQRACCFLVPPWFWGAFFIALGKMKKAEKKQKAPTF